MHFEGEPVIAFCYISKEGDNKNVCYLTSESLFVRYKNRLSKFDKNSVQGITFEHKILLFPLVAGGIMTPLSIHALLHSYTNPWVLLSLMIIGLILMYFGWEGSSTFTVKTSVKDYDFFIRQPTANLSAFAEFVQHYTSDDERARMFYFTKRNAEWQRLKTENVLKVDSPLILKNWRQINEENLNPNDVILGIDPVDGNIQIDFIQTPGKELQATVTSDISVTHIKELNRPN